MKQRRILATIAALLWLAAGPATAQSVPGVSVDRIAFGQSAALSGPAAELGNEMRRGIVAAFDEINRKGGVQGRRLELISHDDRYEPEAAIANTEKLIRDDQVFALIGEVGTPTSAAAEPIAAQAGVPFIAPFTGAEFLRDPKLTHVVNVRASYFQETEKIVDGLTRDLAMTRIGVLYQDDSYGRTGLTGVTQALQRRDLALAGTATYLRNTTAVKTALLSLREQNPQAIIIIGAYEPSAVFTRWARKLGVDAMIFNISFVGSNPLAAALGPVGAGVYVTQVVPTPNGDTIPLLAQYRAALKASAPESRPSFISLEAYVAGRLTIDILGRLGANPSRAAFLACLAQTGVFDIGGFTLRYGAQDNRGSDQVFLTMIRQDGSIVPVNRLSP